ncbi:MAG: hypothetical protein AVDCRST_MAG85-3424 [uncultured Solirubrobacteraceae bacterium]|uniref:Uncharacterized protein n=1 Tax=uncultured Solirubrobacteraceae bacterium TaxID=1162706 RepID=A0A6J4TNE6_9ACTN|nr:MAG: hypothetical protein AVDCRST_MAG85-3424 [uncultured Solirubrobacteraceae bacterium]
MPVDVFTAGSVLNSASLIVVTVKVSVCPDSFGAPLSMLVAQPVSVRVISWPLSSWFGTFV